MPQEALDHLRNSVFAFYTSANLFFTMFVAGTAPGGGGARDVMRQYVERLQSLNAQGYLSLLSVLHADFAVAAWNTQPGLLRAAIEAMARVYNRPHDFAQSWLSCLERVAQDGSGNFPTALGHATYDALCPILGLEPGNCVPMALWWSGVTTTISEWARDYINRPDFLKQVRAGMLAAASQ